MGLQPANRGKHGFARSLHRVEIASEFAMNKPLQNIEAARWSKIGRRWMTVLAVLLTINLSLVALAVSGYAARPATTLADDSTSDNGDEQVASATVEQGSDEETSSSDSTEPAQPNSGTAVELATVAPAVNALPALPPKDDTRIAPQPPQVASLVAAPDETSQPTAETPEVATTTPIRTPGADDARALGPVVQHPGLVIINPPTTAGEVHYTVDGAVFCLQPGEYQQLEGAQARRITFHQGDDLADIDRSIEPGVFVFAVSDAGWQLVQPTSAAVGRLLGACREIETK
jgi:hypothetical protein